jgi:hypothetical protein
MELIDRITSILPERVKKSVLSQINDRQLTIEAVSRGTSSKLLSGSIEKEPSLFTPQSLEDWNMARVTALDPKDPSLVLLSQLYDNLLLDQHLKSTITTRVMRVARSRFHIVNDAGEPNDELSELFERPWFEDYVSQIVWQRFTGVKVLEGVDLDDNLELIRLTELPMAHLLPWRGEVAKKIGDTTGISYVSGSMAQSYMQIGEDREIGELSDLAPLILAKKLVMGSWLDYVEKYSITPRYAVTDNPTDEREKYLFDMLMKSRSADVAVLRKGEELLSMESNDRDAYMIYKELYNILNDELSKAILGQAGTVDAKEKTGTYGSMQVMQGVTEDRHHADKLLVKHMVNTQLIPFLQSKSSAYSGLANHQLIWDESEEISHERLGTIVVQLAQAGFELDHEQISERLGITIKGFTRGGFGGGEPPKKEEKGKE